MTCLILFNQMCSVNQLCSAQAAALLDHELYKKAPFG